jgi:acyl carrier protein
MGDTQGSGSENQLESRIRSLVADQLGVDISEVIPGANILDDLGADSLDVVELVMSLEDAFDIEVPDEVVEGMRTIGDIEKYVVAHAS